MKELPVPATYTRDEINAAIDRLGAGFGVRSSRYMDISMGRAQDILRAAFTELIELRSETRRYICTKCKIAYDKPEFMQDVLCPKCDTLLRPETMIVRALLEERVAELETKVRHLEDSLVVLLDLNLDED